jgi:hypothetical protein
MFAPFFDSATKQCVLSLPSPVSLLHSTAMAKSKSKNKEVQRVQEDIQDVIDGLDPSSAYPSLALSRLLTLPISVLFNLKLACVGSRTSPMHLVLCIKKTFLHFHPLKSQ